VRFGDLAIQQLSANPGCIFAEFCNSQQQTVSNRQSATDSQQQTVSNRQSATTDSQQQTVSNRQSATVSIVKQNFQQVSVEI
jgi:hypothetical protein